MKVSMVRAGSAKIPKTAPAPAPIPGPVYRAPLIIPHSTPTRLQRTSNGSASIIDALTSAPDSGSGNAPPVTYETVSQGAITGGGAGGGSTTIVTPEKKSSGLGIAAALAALYFLG